MTGQNQEHWQRLCQLVAEEKDPARFSQLVQELLEELRKRDELQTPPAKSHGGGEFDIARVDERS